MTLAITAVDWYAARAGGVVAYLLLSAVVIVGLTVAVLADGEYVYIYGTDEPKPTSIAGRYLIVARAPLAKIEDQTTWRFYRKGEWGADFRVHATGMQTAHGGRSR